LYRLPEEQFPPVEMQHPLRRKVSDIRGKSTLMRRPRSILVLCVVLAFGTSLAVPAEDVPETAYDESEALPYEGAPLFSIVISAKCI
jgi:hypothetical protein